MIRWLIVLIFAAACCPDPAAASTRAADVPLWKRLLAIVTPSQAPAARYYVRRHVRDHHALTAARARRPVVAATPDAPAPLDDPSAPAATAEAATGSLPAAAPRHPPKHVRPPVTVAAAAPPAALAASAPAVENAPPITGAIAPASVPESAPSGHEPAHPLAEVAPVSPPPAPPRPVHKKERTAAVGAPMAMPSDVPPAEQPDSPTPPVEPEVRAPRSRPTGGDSACNGGHRIRSAYYWEGHHTASGQPFNPHGLTAAHRTLPFGTRLTVTNPRTGQTVTVIINDRGPFVQGVSLDLSLGAAKAIGMHGTGTVCIL